MRAYLPSYDLVAPKNLKDALARLAREPGTLRPFAGGTDLMVVMETGRLTRGRYLSLWGLKELRGVAVTRTHLVLGALTTYSEVREHKLVAKRFPLLARAAAETGAIAIQNRGTLGGNIANASPAADSPPALLAYDAEIELVSAKGSRWVPYLGFHTGYKQTVMKPDELIRRIRLPLSKPAPTKHHYRKVGTRKAQAISKVCLAATARMGKGRKLEDMRICFGSVAPVPLRCLKTEELLRGKKLTPELVEQARAAVLAEVTPIDDIRSTAKYRRQVAANLVADFLRGLK